jgi:AraC family transcriptional regulator of adaptative response/methylated-DNA-[protein]-cysteine methyltransferase
MVLLQNHPFFCDHVELPRNGLSHIARRAMAIIMNEFTHNIMADTIDYMVAHYQDQPDLTFLAARAGYEPTHFQKLFKDHVGISPKRLNQYMNMRHASGLLQDGQTTLFAAAETGLSGNGRLHDLFVTVEGATPGEVQKRGQGMVIYYGYHQTSIGTILIGQTQRGLCWLGFVMNDDRHAPYQAMVKKWPQAQMVEDAARTQDAATQILQIWAGDEHKGHEKLRLDLHGTNFQLQVWRALLQIPCGKLVTYQHIASQLGRDGANRAVGNAVGANPISVLIPCHRVIRASGIIDNYAWGSARKKLLLGMELADG